MVPSPPDLNSEGYLRHFLAWRKDLLQHYVDFNFTEVARGITAIELSFLNSPANRISLPDIELFSVVVYGQTFVADMLTPIASTLTDNQDLVQTDNAERTVTLQPATAINGSFIRIIFQFTDFHDFDWFFLSEVRFCTDPQPLMAFNVMFQPPPSTIVQPSADNLRGGSTELVCTVY